MNGISCTVDHGANIQNLRVLFSGKNAVEIRITQLLAGLAAACISAQVHTL